MIARREELWDNSRGVFQPGGWWKHPTARVGCGTIIYPGVFIGPNVQVGADCVIAANTVIGGPGFGYVTDERGEHVYREHVQGVVIADDVHIGANTCIDQGRHRTTRIGRGTRIDNLVHIAHNVIVGERCQIIAHSMVAGSVEIGDDATISPGALIRDHRDIGAGAHVGQGANVVRPVMPGQTVAGNPARPL
jgi:UDP-3-O-[3-hydroxymyristoyl] glucosamine N-acyltransferase